MLTNAELLQDLLSIQGRVEYDTVLEELIDTVEKAVSDEEFETARRTDTVPDDAEDIRWVPAGTLDGMRAMAYRDTL